MKVVKVQLYDGTIHCYYHCPGCDQPHLFSPLVHEWNGDRNIPTVHPSLLQDNPDHYQTCHSYIKEGMIEFQADCWHDLKNQTVPLPEFNIDMFDIDLVKILEE